MAEVVQRVLGAESLAATPEGVRVFGVRHLSPASAWHLSAVLEQLRPKCVLIEGPSDANALIPQLGRLDVKPPVALLSYTTESPVRTVLYPFAEYSPELKAIHWALSNRAEVRFIDLPSSASISYGEVRRAMRTVEHDDAEPEVEQEVERMVEQAVERDTANYRELESRLYADITRLSGEPDYESFWEREFEREYDAAAFVSKVRTLSEGMRRELEQPQWENDRSEAAYNLVRESFMRSEIERTVADGFAPTEIVAVTGAFHVTGLTEPNGAVAMTAQERDALPKSDVRLTLMPYSYYRLSSQSGYGAGNKAPRYFGLLWDCFCRDDARRLAPLYLSELGDFMRTADNYVSTANVIEAVRLSDALASLHSAEFPTLNELHESAATLLGEGELVAVADAIARTDVGTEIGELSEGVSQTPMQDDMNRQLKALRLESYKSTVAQDLALDLREKRGVANRDAALIDLHRSVFFQRLKLLNIRFADQVREYNASAWSEKWVLRWSPETEIEVVEATLIGETVETASAFALKERFDAAVDIGEVARLMGTAFICALLGEVPNGLTRLQTLCVDGTSFTPLATACRELANIIQYRDVRGFDAEPLTPILRQIFLKAALVMFGGANCDDDAATAFVVALNAMHQVSQEQFEHVDDDVWLEKLREVAESDSRNARISGAAAAILLERGAMSDDELKTEVARRLSYGTPASLAAQWFEGLCGRNHYVLLSRVSIWRQLDDYLQALDDDDFKRAVVFLRRTFGGFTPREKNAITELLADMWGVDSSAVGERLLAGELTDEESAALDSLNDFDF